MRERRRNCRELLGMLRRNDLYPLDGDDSPSAEKLAVAVHAALLRSRSMLKAIQLADVLGQTDAFNIPGNVERVSELAAQVRGNDREPRQRSSTTTPYGRRSKPA